MTDKNGFINLVKINALAKLDMHDEFIVEYSKLTPIEQIDEEFLTIAVDSFIRWGDFSKASLLIEKAREFHSKRKSDYPNFLFSLEEKLGNNGKNLERIAYALKDSISLSFAKFTKIVPGVINEHGVKDYRHFIAYEIVLAAKAMLEKIKSVNKLNYENMYTDVLEALLNSRIEAYGRRGFTSQNRSGTSGMGKEAGSIDLMMKCERDNIVIEAIRWYNPSFKSDLQEHLRKVFNYDPSRSAFYDVIYFESNNAKLSFNDAWSKFRDEIFPELTFPKEYEKDGTEDLSSTLGTNTVKVFLSKHKNNLYFYHILIDIEYCK